MKMNVGYSPWDKVQKRLAKSRYRFETSAVLATIR